MSHEPARPACIGETSGARCRRRRARWHALPRILRGHIRNPHTRRAYARAAEEFLGWCASVGVRSIADVQPVHVATWI
jgi:integrase/recombinase XerC